MMIHKLVSGISGIRSSLGWEIGKLSRTYIRLKKISAVEMNENAVELMAVELMAL